MWVLALLSIASIVVVHVAARTHTHPPTHTHRRTNQTRNHSPTHTPTGALRRPRRPWRYNTHVFAGVLFAAVAGLPSVGRTFEGVVVDAAPEIVRVYNNDSNKTHSDRGSDATTTKQQQRNDKQYFVYRQVTVAKTRGDDSGSDDDE